MSSAIRGTPFRISYENRVGSWNTIFYKKVCKADQKKKKKRRTTEEGQKLMVCDFKEHIMIIIAAKYWYFKKNTE